MRTHTSQRRLFLLAGLMIGFFALRAPLAAHAQPPSVIDARERVTESIGKLEEISGTGGDEEIAARKESLAAIIAFTVLENGTLLQNLSDLGEVEAEFFIGKESLIAKFEAFKKYLAEKEAQLVSLSSVENISEFASSLNTWREEEYGPKVKEAIDLTLLYRSKAAIATADARFEKIAAFLKDNKTARARRAEWHPLLTQAALSLKNAREAHNEANRLVSLNLAHYLPDPENPATPSSEAPTAVSSLSSKTTAPTPTVSQFVQDTLDELKLTYAYFIKIAKLFNK